VDRLDALHVAVKAVRRGGTVSVNGVYGGEADPMPMMEMFDRGIQLRMGQDHHLPLEQAPQGYEIFRNKEDGCIKVVLQP
jgi:threonine dehydrogenase-like Zn-dependent dehydrogenase